MASGIPGRDGVPIIGGAESAANCMPVPVPLIDAATPMPNPLAKRSPIGVRPSSRTNPSGTPVSFGAGASSNTNPSGRSAACCGVSSSAWASLTENGFMSLIIESGDTAAGFLTLAVNPRMKFTWLLMSFSYLGLLA